MRRSNFLSRLCGGEFLVHDDLVEWLFLSRLCGGESASFRQYRGGTFLSRLCGGEYFILIK